MCLSHDFSTVLSHVISISCVILCVSVHLKTIIRDLAGQKHQSHCVITETRMIAVCRQSSLIESVALCRGSDYHRMLHDIKESKSKSQAKNVPNDHTSDLLLNLLYLMTSGADHLTGNLEPWELVYWSSSTNLEREECTHHYATVWLHSDDCSTPKDKVKWREWSLRGITWSYRSQTPSPRCSWTRDSSWQPAGHGW